MMRLEHPTVSVHWISPSIVHDNDVRTASSVAPRHISHHHSFKSDHFSHDHACHHSTSNTHALPWWRVIVSVPVLRVWVWLLVDNHCCGRRGCGLLGWGWRRQWISIVVEHGRHLDHIGCWINRHNHHTVLVISWHAGWGSLTLRNRLTIHIIHWCEWRWRHHRRRRLHHGLLWIDHNRLSILVEHGLPILVKLLNRLLLHGGLLHLWWLWIDHDRLTILIEHGLAILIQLLNWLGLLWLLHGWWRHLSWLLLLHLWWLLLRVDHDWLSHLVKHWLSILV